MATLPCRFLIFMYDAEDGPIGGFYDYYGGFATIEEARKEVHVTMNDIFYDRSVVVQIIDTEKYPMHEVFLDRPDLKTGEPGRRSLSDEYADQFGAEICILDWDHAEAS